MRSHALLSLCVLAACTTWIACGGDSAGKSAPASGAQLFTVSCALCHTESAQGGPLGPSLIGVAPHWTKETLIAYLRDPVGYAAKDPRLKAQGAKFKMPMMSFKTTPQADLEKIAEYVLSLK
jgi:mono/diheme cytochrome c family protein